MQPQTATSNAEIIITPGMCHWLNVQPQKLTQDGLVSVEQLRLKGFISAVLAAVRRCPPKFPLRLQKAQQLWLQELLSIDHVLQQRYKSNLPTARQAAGHVPWANIVKLRDKLW